MVLNIYWDFEIEISLLVAKYKMSRKKLFANKDILSLSDRKHLEFVLWERVNCLQKLNKKSNVIQFPKQ
jgi:hypothetical protein